MRLELQDSHKPSQVWLARIIENVGGRLYLRVEGMDSGIADFWAFYLNENLHPIGWGKQMGYFYHPPQGESCMSKSEMCWGGNRWTWVCTILFVLGLFVFFKLKGLWEKWVGGVEVCWCWKVGTIIILLANLFLSAFKAGSLRGRD